ncbi:MAG: TraB/GumN family protein [Erysipelotrichaceae bacterium]|nr:TraB/GumN family protein [Erysipelotrichaceae bacterium]
MENIKKINYDDKEIYIIPTAHVSKVSAQEVKEVIETLKPDSVCIELDKDRYESLLNPNKWLNTNIFEVIKTNRSGYMMANLLLSSYQKRIAKQLDIKAGQEMIQAIESAKEIGSEIVLVDRSIQTTFTRIYRKNSFINKIKLIVSIISLIFDDSTIDEKEIENLKQTEVLENALSSVSKEFPDITKVLVNERDKVLSHKIKNAPGKVIVAVLGAAHVPGVLNEINNEVDIEELESVPPKSKTGTIIGFIIALIFISLIIYTFINNPSKGIDQILTWILWNGGLSAFGVLLAFGHPLSILTAFVAAPITSLNPLLAAGWFAGLVEAFLRKPLVKDFENISEDVSSIKGIYKNRITRILLVVIFANLFSSIGTFIGGYDVVKIFFSNF